MSQKQTDIQEKTEDSAIEPNTCENCIHFRLHYIRQARGRYVPLLYGHCVTPHRKKRFTDDKACAYWQGKAITADDR